jgi:hypothetical protein
MPFASSLFAAAASFEALRQSRRFSLMADGFAVCCFFLKLTTAAGSGDYFFALVKSQYALAPENFRHLRNIRRDPPRLGQRVRP